MAVVDSPMLPMLSILHYRDIGVCVSASASARERVALGWIDKSVETVASVQIQLTTTTFVSSIGERNQ
jgi:hypothetical protein